MTYLSLLFIYEISIITELYFPNITNYIENSLVLFLPGIFSEHDVAVLEAQRLQG